MFERMFALTVVAVVIGAGAAGAEGQDGPAEVRTGFNAFHDGFGENVAVRREWRRAYCCAYRAWVGEGAEGGGCG